MDVRVELSDVDEDNDGGTDSEGEEVGGCDRETLLLRDIEAVSVDEADNDIETELLTLIVGDAVLVAELEEVPDAEAPRVNDRVGVTVGVGVRVGVTVGVGERVEDGVIEIEGVFEKEEKVQTLSSNGPMNASKSENELSVNDCPGVEVLAICCELIWLPTPTPIITVSPRD